MRKLLFYVALLSVSIYLGLYIQQDTGYVLFSYQDWVIETSLWLVIFAGLLLFFVGHKVLILSGLAGSLVGRFKIWLANYRVRKASNWTSYGLIQFTEGNWEVAERYLLKGINEIKEPLINYLAAAKAAQEQNADDRRDDYLRLAHQTSPEAIIAVGLTQAQLQLGQSQLEQSLVTLQNLRKISPKHIYVLKLLKNLYIDLNDWNSILKILPDLKRYQILTSEELTKLTKQAYHQLLLEAFKQDSSQAGKMLWDNMPYALRDDLELLRVYAKLLLSKGEDKTVYDLLTQVLSKNWDNELIYLYGQVKSNETTRQISKAEQWLKKHRQNPMLLLTLGHLCLREQLWGKARSYFEESIAIEPSIKAHNVLAQLLEQLGETSLALENYKAAVELANKDVCSNYLKRTY